MITLANEQIEVVISPLGAELQSMISLSDGAQWLWQGDSAWWTGRSPLLFPIVGQAPSGEIVAEGQAYEMRSHGFARNSLFEVLAQDQTSAVFTLNPSDTTKAVYPYDFKLIVQYQLQGCGLSVSVTVQNHDTRAMPFQFGFHPAFVWPLPQAQGQRHWVQFPDQTPQDMRRLAGGIMADAVLAPPLKGDAIEIDPADYEADAMVFPNLAAQTYRYQADHHCLEMQVKNLPDFALWQKPGAPFICLEPWHGMAPYPAQGQSLAARPNAIELPPRQERNFEMTLRLSKA